LGGPWAFYKQFWKAHDLPGIAGIFQPEVRVGISSEANVPLLLHNDTAQSATFDLTADSPQGWGQPEGVGAYLVRPGESREVNIAIATPGKPESAQAVRTRVNAAGAKLAEFEVNVTLASGSLPQ
jgi:hypothetical protein